MSATFLDLALGIHVCESPSVDQRDDMGRPARSPRSSALTALETSGSAIGLDEMRLGAETGKCIDITPGLRRKGFAALADDEMQNSTSPDFTSCRTWRLLPELRARILLDQHGALAQRLQACR